MPELIDQSEEQLPLYPTGVGLGTVLINPDVIARIAARAVMEVEGVQLGSRFSLADVKGIFAPKEPVKGIHVVQNNSGRHSIVCEVKIAYGRPMREIAERLQRHMKDMVERMTSLDLEAIDVRIVDIFDEKDKKERDREEEV